ncbi:MAG TPA: hypothetical protein VN457_03520, partial [Chlamydiales bacterium]|nr:hypothetical protein [Chlamydiales bacterium]
MKNDIELESAVELRPVQYDRHHPFYASILRRFRLNKEGGTRETWHFELDISGSHIAYEPGDSIAIL